MSLLCDVIASGMLQHDIAVKGGAFAQLTDAWQPVESGAPLLPPGDWGPVDNSQRMAATGVEPDTK